MGLFLTFSRGAPAIAAKGRCASDFRRADQSSYVQHAQCRETQSHQHGDGWQAPARPPSEGTHRTRRLFSHQCFVCDRLIEPISSFSFSIGTAIHVRTPPSSTAATYSRFTLLALLCCIEDLNHRLRRDHAAKNVVTIGTNRRTPACLGISEGRILRKTTEPFHYKSVPAPYAGSRAERRRGIPILSGAAQLLRSSPSAPSPAAQP